jgi:hypothetical protein
MLRPGDSLLVVQQVAGEFQYLEGTMNMYLDMCLDIIASFTEFKICHVPRHENFKANMLAQQAYDFDIGGRNFISKKSRCKKLQVVRVCQNQPSQF